jgi:tetratricopeptide (TPR) repeat protein
MSREEDLPPEIREKFKRVREKRKQIDKMLNASRRSFRDPDNPELMAKLAMEYVKMRSYKGAMREIEKALAIEPDNFNYIGVKATIYMMTHEDEKALEWTEKMIAANPAYVRGYEFKAQILIALKRYQDALTHIDEALKQFPDSKTLHETRKIAKSLI